MRNRKKGKSLKQQSISASEIISKHYQWIYALISFSITGILMFLNRIKAIVYFNYYAINLNLFNESKTMFPYYIGVIIIVFLMLNGIALSLEFFAKLKLLVNEKRWVKVIKWVFNFLNITFLNIFIILLMYYSTSFNTQMYIFIIVSVIFICILNLEMSKMIKCELKSKKVSNSLESDLSKFLKVLPIIIIIFIISFVVSTINILENKRSYYIIDDVKAVVYTTTDYYIVLGCKIEDEKLILYKGKQTKIDNTNVTSMLQEFKEVEFE